MRPYAYLPALALAISVPVAAVDQVNANRGSRPPSTVSLPTDSCAILTAGALNVLLDIGRQIVADSTSDRWRTRLGIPAAPADSVRLTPLSAVTCQLIATRYRDARLALQPGTTQALIPVAVISLGNKYYVADGRVHEQGMSIHQVAILDSTFAVRRIERLHQ
jgi:hypothetical protein